MEKENMILVRDNGDYEYIYGVIILKGNVLDMNLFQKRLDDMREELGYDDYNGDDIVEAVIKKYEDYKGLKYIHYNEYDLEV
jgi:hypothetical protein